MMLSATAALAIAGALVAVFLHGCLEEHGQLECAELSFGANGTVPATHLNLLAVPVCPFGTFYSGPALMCGIADKICLARNMGEAQETNCYLEHEFVHHGKALTSWPIQFEPSLVNPDISPTMALKHAHFVKTNAKIKASNSGKALKPPKNDFKEAVEKHTLTFHEMMKSKAEDTQKAIEENAKKLEVGRRLESLPRVVRVDEMKCETAVGESLYSVSADLGGEAEGSFIGFKSGFLLGIGFMSMGVALYAVVCRSRGLGPTEQGLEAVVYE